MRAAARPIRRRPCRFGIGGRLQPHGTRFGRSLACPSADGSLTGRVGIRDESVQRSCDWPNSSRVMPLSSECTGATVVRRAGGTTRTARAVRKYLMGLTPNSDHGSHDSIAMHPSCQGGEANKRRELNSLLSSLPRNVRATGRNVPGKQDSMSSRQPETNN